MESYWQGKTANGTMKYGREFMPVGSIPGSAPGVADDSPSMNEKEKEDGKRYGMDDAQRI